MNELVAMEKRLLSNSESVKFFYSLSKIFLQELL